MLLPVREQSLELRLGRLPIAEVESDLVVSESADADADVPLASEIELSQERVVGRERGEEARPISRLPTLMPPLTAPSRPKPRCNQSHNCNRITPPLPKR